MGKNRGRGKQGQQSQEGGSRPQSAPAKAEGDKMEVDPPSEKVDSALKEPTSADYYFDSYSHFGIHEEMLKDKVRTDTYRRSLVENAHLMKGKVVLDIGCGTGILSMFAAQAGAKHVYGIECSGICEQAKKIVEKNGFADRVTIIKGKVEEIDLPVEKVDVIVSEWMGYFLLYESMLDTVLYARDKWLNPGGIILPDKATMYICGIEDGDYKDEKINFWDDVYGFDFSCIKELAILEPLVDTVDANSICTNHSAFFKIDILTVKKEDLDFKCQFKIQAKQNDYIHAFVVYFDVGFTQLHKPIFFGTGPQHKYTHWKQTVFYTEEPLVVHQNDVITGWISAERNAKNPRDLNINLHYTSNGKDCKVDKTQFYRLR